MCVCVCMYVCMYVCVVILCRIPVAVHQLDTPQGLGTGPNCSFYAIRAGLSQFRAYLKGEGEWQESAHVM